MLYIVQKNYLMKTVYISNISHHKKILQLCTSITTNLKVPEVGFTDDRS